MNKFFIGLTAALSLSILVSINAFADIDFRLQAKDGTILVTHSAESSMDLKSELRTSPRDRVFTVTGPDGKPGLTWTAKYGYLFLSSLGVDAATDGMNEAGLSFEALYLPHATKYQTVPLGDDAKALPYFELGDWILSNFKTVDEVREALSHIYVYDAKIPGMGDTTFPLHFSVYDTSGKGIVIEYNDGQLNVYDNKLGVMTNTSAYHWHINQSSDQIQQNSTHQDLTVTDKITFTTTKQNSDMMNLNALTASPRFVKIGFLMDVATPPNNATEAVNLAEHIINNVDVPMNFSNGTTNQAYLNGITQWVVFKDLTHKIFYYRTYNDLTLHSISMSKLDFSKDAPRLKMSISSSEYVEDMTAEFLKSKQN